MKKELFISTVTLIALTACSESEKAAGGTIEDNNASLEEWFNYGLDWKESAYAKIVRFHLHRIQDKLHRRSKQRISCTQRFYYHRL